MDCQPARDPDFVTDLECGTGVIRSIEEGLPDPSLGENLPKTDFTWLCDQKVSVDDDLERSSANPLAVNKDCPENNVKVVIDSKVEGEKVGDFTEKKMGKEKRKKASSAKKPPKPPRPPRGFSLDAADQKLIKELAELAMMKRARIERMKALKQKKTLKTSSSSMSGSLFAMLFTIIFFLMLLLQGMSCRNPGVTSAGSPQTAQTNENGLIFIQEQLNPSASDSKSNSKSSNLFENISGSGFAGGKSTVAE